MKIVNKIQKTLVDMEEFVGQRGSEVTFRGRQGLGGSKYSLYTSWGKQGSWRVWRSNKVVTSSEGVEGLLVCLLRS